MFSLLLSGEAKDSKADAAAAPAKRPPSPPYPRPSSPIVLVPPLKKRRKTVSFSTDENDSKTQPQTAPLSPSPSPLPGESPLLSPGRLPDSPASAPSTRPTQGIQLLPFASKPGEGNALIVPPPERTHDSADESKKGPPFSPQPTPVKSPSKRGAGKDSPKSPAPPVMVCRTVQNLPLDHASMCRMAFEEAPPPPPVNKRARGRPRTTSLSTSSCHSLREEDEDEEENEQRLRFREQLGASSLLQLASATDLSVLADVALKMDPDAGDSEETETSDEAEEQKLEQDLFSPESLALVLSPEVVVVLMEHNYGKPPVIPVSPGNKRTSSKQDPSVLLPADLNTISGVLEAPEEVIGEALPARGDAGEYFSTMGVLCESEDGGQAASLPPSAKKKQSVVGKGFELEKDKSKKRRRKDKENQEVHHTKKQKEQPGKKQRKRKLEVSTTGFFPLSSSRAVTICFPVFKV